MRALRALAIVLVLFLAGCGSSTETGQPIEQSRDGPFVPRSYADGDRVVLPVVFPDGTAAELVYPEELDVAALGVQPYSSGYLHGKSPNSLRSDVVGRDFWIFHGNLRDVLVEVNEGRPPRLLDEYRGAGDTTVGFWELAALGEPELGFQFGRWAVLVYDYTDAAAMTDAERAAWAASFSGRETKEGYLLLEGTGPLRIASAGEHAGPELNFGEPGGTGFSLFPGRCVPHQDMDEVVAGRRVDRSPGFAHWCLSPSMRIHATGPERFITILLRELEIRNVRVAGRPAG